MKKIIIIGAGWYGCHLALALHNSGFQVKIIEKERNIFLGASKKNQNRLHLGFHYPRNYSTRVQSREGFSWFLERYGFLTRECPNNIYAIATNDSIVDFNTYMDIMRASGLEFYETKNSLLNLKNIEGSIVVGERVIDNNAAAIFFREKLSGLIDTCTLVDLNNPETVHDLQSTADFVIDCTWSTAKSNTKSEVFFEPCIYFYYENKSTVSFGLTIMDGPFFSLYPYADNLYTLTSVEDGPLGKFSQYTEAVGRIRELSCEKFIREKRETFERGFNVFYPDFLTYFAYHSVEFSIKSKTNDRSDFRGCTTSISGNLVEVFSGKIDTLHIAEQEVLKILR